MPIFDSGELIAQLYRKLGVAQPRESSMGPLPEIAPPETADLEAPGSPIMDQLLNKYAEEVQRKGEPGFLSWAATPFRLVGNALSAGEYGVASAIRSAVKLARGESTLDPFSSFLKGVAAGFNDDEAYQTRMYDVLSELGWDPDTTTGRVGKAVLGFGLGMALDPLTWIGIGPAAKSLLISRRAIQEVAKESGVTLATNIAKGQWAKKAGVDLQRSFIKQHAERLIGERASGMIKDVDNIMILEKASQEGARDFIKTWLPGLNLEEKGAHRVDEALKVLGRATTRENREWFINEGWKKLLDPGGISLRIPFTTIGTRIAGPSVMNARASSFTGLLIGEALAENVPLSYKAINKITSSRGWQTLVTKHVTKMVEGFNRKFRTFSGMDIVDRVLFHEIVGAMAEGQDISRRLAAGMLATDDVAEREIVVGGAKFAIPETTTSILAPKLQVLLARILYDADYLKKEGEEFAEWVSKALGPGGEREHWVKDLGLGQLSEKQMKDIKTVGGRIQRHFQRLREFDSRMGVEYTAREAYVAHVMGAERARIVDPEALPTGTSRREWHETARNLNAPWDTVQNLKIGTGKGEILAKPIEDLLAVIQNRTASSFGRYYTQQTAQEIADRVGRHRMFVKGAERVYDPMIREMLADQQFLKEYPELALEMADASRLGRKGLPAMDARKVEGLFKNLREANSVQKVDIALTKFTDDLPRLLTPENIQDINSEMYAVLKDNTKKWGENAPAVTLLQSEWPQVVGKLEARSLTDASIASFSPAVQALEDAGKGISHVYQKFSDIGKQRALPQLIAQMEDAPKPLEEVTLGTINRLKELVDSPKPNARITRFLEAPMEHYAQAKTLGKLRVTLPGSGQVVTGDRFSLPEPLAREITRFLDPTKHAESLGGPMQALNWITRPLKRWLTTTTLLGLPRPSNLIRNFISVGLQRGIGMSTAFSLPDLETTRTAIFSALGKGAGRTLETAAGVTFKGDELFQDLRKSGLWLHTFAKTDARTMSLADKLFQEYSTGAYVSWRYFKNKLLKVLPNPDDINAFTENFQRLEGYMNLLKQGVPRSNALDLIRETFFSYQNMTDFERKLSNVILFYNWQRQAVPWALKQLQRNPWVYSAVNRFKDMAFDSRYEEARVPKWVRDYPFVGFGKTPEGNLRIMSFRNIFSIDVLDDVFPDNLRELMGKVNPLLTFIPEIAAGRDLYFGRDIDEVKTIREERSDSMFRFLEGFLGSRQVTLADGKTYWRVDGERWHALNRLWFSRFYREADTMAGAFEGKKGILDALTNLVFGFKMYEYDLMKQQWFIDQEAKKLKGAYSSAIRSGDRHRALEILRQAATEYQ